MIYRSSSLNPAYWSEHDFEYVEDPVAAEAPWLVWAFTSATQFSPPTSVVMYQLQGQQRTEGRVLIVQLLAGCLRCGVAYHDVLTMIGLERSSSK